MSGSKDVCTWTGEAVLVLLATYTLAEGNFIFDAPANPPSKRGNTKLQAVLHAEIVARPPMKFAHLPPRHRGLHKWDTHDRKCCVG